MIEAVDYRDMLEQYFQLENYQTIIDFGKSYEEFFERYAITQDSILVSYEGGKTRNLTEDSSYTTVEEEINVYIYTSKNFIEARKDFKRLVDGDQVEIDGVGYYITLSGFEFLEDNGKTVIIASFIGESFWV